MIPFESRVLGPGGEGGGDGNDGSSKDGIEFSSCGTCFISVITLHELLVPVCSLSAFPLHRPSVLSTLRGSTSPRVLKLHRMLWCTANVELLR